ncbi:MAG: SDR family oxidoreductase [Deltaproteobacteria bacterium]|nr:SDR family oxidoreductase [Deltaproteobacteria bacterium]
MSDKKKILITGASSGFGLGASKALAAKGHVVFASMRGPAGKNAAQAQALRDFATQGQHALHIVEIDVTQDSSVASGVEQMIAAVGGIDILINNAGVGTWGLQEGFTPDQVKNLFDINVVGPLRMNRAVLPHMRRAGGGYIVYVSSGLGRIQFPFLGPYTASKHAVEAIAESGAYELTPQGIDTTILQPGAYGTSFLSNSIHPKDGALIEDQPAVKAMFTAFAGGFEARAKSGQLGNPQEIIDALVELVELPKSDRPLRKTVGADVQGPVRAINERCAEVQGELLRMFGIR